MKRGRKPGVKQGRNLNFRIEEDTLKEAQEAAKKQGVSLSKFCRQAIKEKAETV